MKQLNNILCALTPSEKCRTALERAVTLVENNQARLTVVDIIEPVTAGIGMPEGGPISNDLHDAVKSDRLNALESFTAPYRERIDIRHDVFTTPGFLAIVRAVLRDRYDLVIKLAEDPDYMDRLFGSDDMQLLRKCPCPVWLMQPVEKFNYATVMAAVDFDPMQPETVGQRLNMDILELASSLALSDFAALHVVHVWDVPELGFVELWSDSPEAARSNLLQAANANHENSMQILRQKLRDQLGQETYQYLSPKFHTLKGSAKTVIPRMAEQLQVDLVVMGTVARTGIAGFLIGNTAEAILDQLKCSVLALKPPGFVTSVEP